MKCDRCSIQDGQVEIGFNGPNDPVFVYEKGENLYLCTNCLDSETLEESPQWKKNQNSPSKKTKPIDKALIELTDKGYLDL